MRVGLFDVDSHNFPNLPLMKLSAFHKSKGDFVEFVTKTQRYDMTYISKVFTETPEPVIPEDGSFGKIVRGGSGYDLQSKLPDLIEHIYPDYTLYPQYPYALGWLTRGCPRCDHTFCITPQKDGKQSIKAADLCEFWRDQAMIRLLDQNILLCKDRIELLEQLICSNAWVDFNGGLDVRAVDDQIVWMLSRLRVKNHHFAWDNPDERLESQFTLIRNRLPHTPQNITVYVLTNYWSTFEQDMYRIEWLRSNGFQPFVMIYDKQKYVDKRGRWLPGVTKIYTGEQLRHFKLCQHLQRWCCSRQIFKTVPDFTDYMRGKTVLLEEQEA